MTECIPILRITDGTTVIDLLSTSGGILLNDWTPALAEIKDGGVFVDNPALHGRRITARNRANPIDVFDVKVYGSSQDAVIFTTQKIRRLLGKAVQYWTTDFQNEPVWIEARGPNETNIRYAVIVDWRMDSDDNPYATPFFNNIGGAAMDDIQIALEHLEWTDVAPGSYSCAEISAGQTGERYDLGFFTPGASSDDANVNISTSAIVLSGGQNFGRNVSSNILGGGIRFRSVPIPNGANIIQAYVHLVASVNTSGATCNGQIDGELNATPAVFSTYADYAARTRTVALVEWPAVPSWTQGNTYVSPNVESVVQEIVNLPGWASGNNLVLFIRDSISAPSSTSALRSYADWDDVTYQEPRLQIVYEVNGEFFGVTASCNEEAYIANQHTLAQLTNIFVYDASAGTYTSIMGTTLPQTLMPAVPATNDIIYFGIATGAINSGPFTNIVFDLTTAATNVTGITWQYWNGAWITLYTQASNSIGNFSNLGINVVAWERLANWTTTTINGVTGWWVRALITAGGGATPAQQGNREIYTTIWPYVEIDSAQIGGDITALARTIYRNKAYKGGTFGPYTVTTQLLLGTRSLSRGQNFTPFINLGNTQNNAGIAVTYGTNTSAAAYSASPTGMMAHYNPPGVQAIANRVLITFSPSLAVEYKGYYRVFLRSFVAAGGAAGDFIARFRFVDNYSNATILGPSISVDTEIIDLGTLDFGFITVLPGEAFATSAIQLGIEVSNSNGVPGDLYMYEIILFPIDEWSGEFDLYNNSAKYNEYFDVDSVLFPKTRLRSPVRNTSDEILGIAQNIAPGSFILQANADQRLWYFDKGTYYEIVGTTKVQKVQRYLSMRGFN